MTQFAIKMSFLKIYIVGNFLFTYIVLYGVLKVFTYNVLIVDFGYNACNALHPSRVKTSHYGANMSFFKNSL